VGENVRAVARKFYLEARLNGAPSVEHRTIRDILAAWAAAFGFVRESAPFPNGVFPDVWRRLAKDPRWKFVGEAKAHEDPSDPEVANRLFNYLAIASECVTRRKNPWRGFLFVLAYLHPEDRDAWKTLLDLLIQEAGFPGSTIHDAEAEGVPLLVWEFPPVPLQ
jgi:hypothetical protein